MTFNPHEVIFKNEPPQGVDHSLIFPISIVKKKILTGAKQLKVVMGAAGQLKGKEV